MCAAAADPVARERKGRAVTVERWAPSTIVEEAASTMSLRAALTPRVAALLTAAEAASRLEVEIRQPLKRGVVVLADRYAWTAVAREVARGLEPDWTAALYRFAPPPDLVLFFEQPASAALAINLDRHGPSTSAAAVASAFGPFLERMVRAFDTLVAGAPTGEGGPWPVPVVRVPVQADRDVVATFIRSAVRPLLAASSSAA